MFRKMWPCRQGVQRRFSTRNYKFLSTNLSFFWQESLPLFAADLTSPSLGRLDCDQENILCSTWSTGPAAVWHVQRPVIAEAGQEKPPTPIHMVHVNVTTVTPQDIYNIHAKKTWENARLYEGAWHPMDGWLAKYKLNFIGGCIVYGLGLVPNWVMMIGISFLSRTMM